MGVNFSEVVSRMQASGRFKNMTALANSLGVTPQAISNYKKRGEMPTDLVVRFANDNGFSLDWLIHGREGPAAASPSEAIPQFPQLNPDEQLCINKSLRILRGAEPLSKSFRRTLDMFVEVQEEAEART